MAETETLPAVEPAAQLPSLDRQAVTEIFDASVRRYVASRRERIPEFVDRNFSMGGSLKLHRHAIGLDLVRAPYNVVAGVATAVKNLSAASVQVAGGKNLAERMRGRSFFWKTDVARELEWRLHADFLELPLDQGERRTSRDALVEEILRDPRLAAQFEHLLSVVGERADDAAFKAKVQEAMQEYLGSRAAASDVTASLFAAGAGFAAYQQFTPGAAALSGAVAASIAQSTAVANFWAGSWIGGVYYSVFAAKASPLLFAGVFAGMMVPIAMLTAFAGVIADPVQRATGLHQRRLNKLLNVYEQNLTGGRNTRFVAKDHYVARIMDLLDWSASIIRLAGAR